MRARGELRQEAEKPPGYDAGSTAELVRIGSGEVPAFLGSRPTGLTEREASDRLQSAGKNVIAPGKPPSLRSKAARLLKDPFGLLLLLAGLLALISGIVELGAVVFIIVGLNAALSIVQERRVEKVMLTLQRWLPQAATVVREGEPRRVLASELVPGDVIQVEEGDRVPADARLIESEGLWTNNVPLTGESTPRPRTAEAFDVKGRSPYESPNLIFMGTGVAAGRGAAVVQATGMRTRFGEIAALTGRIRPSASPLQKEIERAAKLDFMLALAVGVSFFLLGTAFFHLDLPASLLLMIGVIVACVPEGLQLTISTALAISLLEMSRHNVLVKRLASVQTLGSVTVICTDKTGTVTTGEMTVTGIWAGGKEIGVSGSGYEPRGSFTAEEGILSEGGKAAVTALLECAALCNNARLQRSEGGGGWTVLGDPTEGALIVAAEKFGLDPDRLREDRPRAGTVPFDSATKRMVTLHRDDGGGLLCVKGSPDAVLPMCSRVLDEEGTTELDDEGRAEAREVMDSMAGRGLRVLAVAFRHQSTLDEGSLSDPRDLVLAGLVGMYDPPRPGVEGSVRAARAAGIRTFMVTGDYGPTAVAIAREVGMVEEDRYRVVGGDDLDGMDDTALAAVLKGEQAVFSRVTPRHKMRIVSVLKEIGEVVAVTGDGANDAPALKKADIGVAMGVSGTDVAREASDMVLLDDSYSSIVTAVRMGRGIYDNIRKFLVYVFSHNWAELIPYLLFGLLAIPLPLLAVQVLAIDLIIDVPPSLALSREPPEPGVMERPPRSRNVRLFDLDFLARSMTVGIVIAAGALLGCFHVWTAGGWQMGDPLSPASMTYREGTTMVFAGIVVAQMANLIGTRTIDTSIARMDWAGNKWVYAGLLWMAATLALIVYLPPLQSVFGTAPLGTEEWTILLGLAVIVVVTDELIKAVARRKAAGTSRKEFS